MHHEVAVEPDIFLPIADQRHLLPGWASHMAVVICLQKHPHSCVLRRLAAAVAAATDSVS